jgi:hypothetical protein
MTNMMAATTTTYRCCRLVLRIMTTKNARRPSRGRKFVGKRPANRKFVGKRAFYNHRRGARESASSDRDNEKSPGSQSTDDGSSDNVKAANADDHWLQAAKLLITADQSAAPSNADSKRANRKYVG